MKKFRAHRRYRCHTLQTKQWQSGRSWGKYCAIFARVDRWMIIGDSNFSNFFGLEKLDKAPREIFSPEIQKVGIKWKILLIIEILFANNRYFKINRIPIYSLMIFEGSILDHLSKFCVSGSALVGRTRRFCQLQIWRDIYEKRTNNRWWDVI